MYPIIECTKNVDKINKLIERGKILLNYRLKFVGLYNRILRYTPFSVLPGYERAVRNYYNFMINEVQEVDGGNYYQMGGPLIGVNNGFFHNMWTFNPLENIIDCKFEDHIFLIPSRYDEFLKVRYGEYMQLPPENQRHPYHGGSYYWL